MDFAIMEEDNDLSKGKKKKLDMGHTYKYAIL